MKNHDNHWKNTIYLTDGGLETHLIFNKGIDLPHFAAFTLLDEPAQSKLLIAYYEAYLALATAHKTGFILESPTWRASPDWGFTLGYSEAELKRVNKKAIEELKALKARYANRVSDLQISGCIGPRGDGYTLHSSMTADEACSYHLLQIEAFRESEVDFVSALTMTNVDEVLGIIMAAKKQQLPVCISYTVETDGHLPSGECLDEAITKIDDLTDHYPLYYMINCAHPSHFTGILQRGHHWQQRIHGIRANASCKSHAELDESTELDAGDPEDLAQWYGTLNHHLPNLKIYGGCCGTDVTHIAAICNHMLSAEYPIGLQRNPEKTQNSARRH